MYLKARKGFNFNNNKNDDRHLDIDYKRNGIALWKVILDYETITIFLSVSEDPVPFSFQPRGVELFIMLYESPFCQNLEERDLWHTFILQKSLFHYNNWIRCFFFFEVQILVTVLSSQSHIQISSQFGTLLMLKSVCNFFGDKWHTYCI